MFIVILYKYIHAVCPAGGFHEVDSQGSWLVWLACLESWMLCCVQVFRHARCPLDVPSCLSQPLWLAREDHLHLESSSPSGLGVFMGYLYKYMLGQVHCRKETLWLSNPGTPIASLMGAPRICVQVKDITSAIHILVLCATSTLLRYSRCVRMRDVRSAFPSCNLSCPS